MVPFRCIAHNIKPPNTTHPPFSHKTPQSLFKAAHNPKSHKTSAFDYKISKKLLNRRVNRPPKVTQLQHVETVQNILRLDVPVDHAVAVEVTDP